MTTTSWLLLGAIVLGIWLLIACWVWRIWREARGDVDDDD
jgi:hypothetical protein